MNDRMEFGKEINELSNELLFQLRNHEANVALSVMNASLTTAMISAGRRKEDYIDLINATITIVEESGT